MLDLDLLLEVDEVETDEDFEIEETILLNFFSCATNPCKSINRVFIVLFASIFGTLNVQVPMVGLEKPN